MDVWQRAQRAEGPLFVAMALGSLLTQILSVVSLTLFFVNSPDPTLNAFDIHCLEFAQTNVLVFIVWLGFCPRVFPVQLTREPRRLNLLLLSSLFLVVVFLTKLLAFGQTDVFTCFTTLVLVLLAWGWAYERQELLKSSAGGIEDR
ncbi:MAG TPA: hypothetical protein VIH47_08835 [Solirubrobacterales bacterium]